MGPSPSASLLYTQDQPLRPLPRASFKSNRCGDKHRVRGPWAGLRICPTGHVALGKCSTSLLPHLQHEENPTQGPCGVRFDGAPGGRRSRRSPHKPAIPANGTPERLSTAPWGTRGASDAPPFLLRGLVSCWGLCVAHCPSLILYDSLLRRGVPSLRSSLSPSGRSQQTGLCPSTCLCKESFQGAHCAHVRSYGPWLLLHNGRAEHGSRGPVVHKAWTVYPLALYRTSLPTLL